MLGVIDLNADVGESFGNMTSGLDEEIIPFVTSVNIATGFHSGDPNWIDKTVKLAERFGISVGAHPSYPDIMGFGRRDMSFEDWEIVNLIKYQVGALLQFVKNKKIQHVKPHGALYNKASSDPYQANAVVNAIKEIDPEIIHVVLSGSIWEDIAKKSGVRVARECFADRAITSDGELVSRNVEGSVISEEGVIIERVIKLAKTGIMNSIDGTPVKISADSLCLHGDNENSVKLASIIRNELENAGIELKPMHTFVK
jgi:UPF0271 protein